MLRVCNIDVSYGDVQILYNVSFEVKEGKIYCLLGANGAGKTTTLKAISGALKPKKGKIEFLDTRIDNKDPSEIVKMGLIQVPEGRQLFSDMTVLENLNLGAYNPRAKLKRMDTLNLVFDMFPRLKERESQKVGTLSGGEQQMVAIGRGLMALPRLLALDEPSLGLAPILVRQMFETIKEINDSGITVLLVEQNLKESLKLANYGYVLETGKINMEGTSKELLEDPSTQKAYLGMK